MTDITTSARELLHQLVEPLRVQLVQLDEAIDDLEKQLAEMRAMRRDVAKTIVSLDPSVAVGTKVKARKITKLTPVNEKTRETILHWLETHREQINANGGMSVMDMIDKLGFTIAGRATLTNALNLFHSQGLVVIDHLGQSGAKNWKLV